jgi:mannose-6-phosphate isomerase-like protein (cupin superfamily)
MVLEGDGEAWMENGVGSIRLKPGVTLVIPAGVRHRFETVQTLKICAVHASSRRIVHVHGDSEPAPR